ncbi:MAG: ATP synthase F0 subunit C [Firmicutes bacterium]|nr:ATP synthase F0 subunit C [Bacillota bacterium]
MKKILKTIFNTILAMTVIAMPVFAEGTAGADGTAIKAIAAAAIMAIAAAAGAIAMAIAVSKAEESTARQPEATGSIRTLMMMGLVFIETAIIYALITAIIIIFVL